MSFNFTKRIDIYNGKNALRNPQYTHLNVTIPLLHLRKFSVVMYRRRYNVGHGMKLMHFLSRNQSVVMKIMIIRIRTYRS